MTQKTIQYKAILLSVTAVLALLVASPALEQIVEIPQTYFITELSILGQYHNATYPSNITVGENYRLYIDVTNRLGASAYYTLEIKFRSQTQSAPDSFAHTASNLQSIVSIPFFVADKATYEIPLDVSFQYAVNSPDQLVVQTITVNGVPLTVNTVINRDAERRGFYGNLFFELWLYNGTTQAFEYHQRYVSLGLRMNV
jgi:uncharacterized membrane protein